MGTRARITHILTVPDSLVLFRGQAGFMRERGYELEFVCSPSPALDAFATAEGARVHGVAMTRQITPGTDARSLAALVRHLRRTKPDLVHSHTPKAGLLGTVGARLAGVGRRVYHVRGLPLATAHGLRRAALEASERTACGVATDVLCVSDSLRREVISRGLVRAGKIRVLGHGSGNGVDALGRFDPDRNGAHRAAVRSRLGIPENAVVVGFVGRLAREKGLDELTRAFERLDSSAHLLLVGPEEPHDPLDAATRERLASARTHLVGHVVDVERMYAAMDVLVLPSHREGFPNVVLEAASMRLPVVVTRVPGAEEAVLDGASGALVPIGDVDALARALERYVREPGDRAAHGARGRAHVLSRFGRRAVWTALAEFYDEVLSR